MVIRHHGNGSHGPPSGNGSGGGSSNGANGSSGDLYRKVTAIARELRAFREEQARRWKEQDRRWEEQRDFNVAIRDSLHNINRHVTSLHLSLMEFKQHQRQIDRLIIRELQALRRSRD